MPAPFLSRDAILASAWYMLSSCLRFCPSHAGIVSKRLDWRSRKQHCIHAKGLLVRNILAKFDWGSLPTGTPNAGGDYRQITSCVTVLCMFLLTSNRMSYALYRMLTMPMTLVPWVTHSHRNHPMHLALPFVLSYRVNIRTSNLPQWTIITVVLYRRFGMAHVTHFPAQLCT